GWRVHGYGMSQTFVKLNSYITITSTSQGLPVGSGFNSMFGTHFDSSNNIEVSDMLIDDNYPALKNINPNVALNLMAIQLRSDGGGHNIHNVNVTNISGGVGANITYEGFPIYIVSASGQNVIPEQAPNNQ